VSTRTCGDCGARNAEDAGWCTQCFTPFPSPPRECAGTVEGDAGEISWTGAEAGPGAGAPATGEPEPSGPAGGHDGGRPESVTRRDVRQTAGGDVEWRCATCEVWNRLELTACVACGAPRRGFGPGFDDPPARLDEDRLVALSLLLPGLGHLRAGLVGSGLARALFGVGWLVGGVLLLVSAARAGAAHLAAVPLLAGAATVWVLTVLDVRSLARGTQVERLDGRALLWLMAGVTGALVLVLTVDTWRLAR
jgi:hypothetical protein